MSGATIWHGGVTPEVAALTELGDQSMPGHIGIEFVEVGPDFMRARMPVDRRTHQPFGRLHGGASVALAETVGSVAAASTIDPARFAAVGMEINANHVRPARDGWVFATVRAENLGRTTQIWSIRIEDEAGKLVCISRLTVAVIEIDRK
ncbi:hotdog fold thioesterase [Pelagerythrobacter marensis]|uniref:Phenylacetic acid degradation-related protein n=1 Tax=Pelagerythrobacter marensis TaxID=543877 RepID=A0A0G3X7A2_9SPHN|nr:hotdog fold thioesterase [Pelagerythrobacter marensis]AKM06253.1 Phenylacetic acid degradation-related protein [Pelagerythrobacter marensis]